jgi:hypothetical protein
LFKDINKREENIQTTEIEMFIRLRYKLNAGRHLKRRENFKYFSSLLTDVDDDDFDDAN